MEVELHEKPIQAERVVEEEINIEELYCWLSLNF
jgi:hypothetical protein